MLDTIAGSSALRLADIPSPSLDQPPDNTPDLCDPILVRRFQRFAFIAAACAVLISVITVIGWLLGIPILSSAGPGWVRMKLNTAVTFLALALALWLIAWGYHRVTTWKLIIFAFIGLAMATAAASLLEDLFGIDLGIDRLLVVEAPGAIETLHPGRLAPLTSVCVLLIGTGLMATTARTSRFNWMIGACSVPILLIAVIVLMGYIQGVRELYTLAGHSAAISFNAGLIALLLGLGTKCIKPDHAMFQRLASAGTGGYMLRRLLPLEVVTITVLVSLRIWGQEAGLFSSIEFGAAFVGLTSIFSVAVMLVWCAARLDALDLARTLAEARVGRLNELLNQKLTDLEAANKELEAFSYSVSHDLRTPLRAIDGFSRILSEDYGDKLDAEGQRLIGIVRDGTRKMAQLIDDILAFSRVSRTDMTETQVNMNDLAQDVLRELSPALLDRDVTFVTPPLPSVRGDKMMLRRVWQNLLDNAVKYSSTHDKARIEVGGQINGSEVAYFVKDDGVGFDMRYVEKLFGVFRRLHGPSEFSGTGIGLAIVKRIITRHGGKVWAEGALEQGASFYFTLPLKETECAGNNNRG